MKTKMSQQHPGKLNAVERNSLSDCLSGAGFGTRALDPATVPAQKGR